MILGLRAQESLLTTLRAEQINCLYPWELPNVTIQHNAADQQLLLVENWVLTLSYLFIAKGLLSWLEV